MLFLPLQWAETSYNHGQAYKHRNKNPQPIYEAGYHDPHQLRSVPHGGPWRRRKVHGTCPRWWPSSFCSSPCRTFPLRAWGTSGWAWGAPTPALAMPWRRMGCGGPQGCWHWDPPVRARPCRSHKENIVLIWQRWHPVLSRAASQDLPAWSIRVGHIF